MLLEKIEALRKESKAKRNRVAFMVALSTTLLIALVWGVSLPSRLEYAFEQSVAEKENSDEPDVTERLGSLREYLDTSLGSIQSQAQLLEAATSSATTTPTPPVTDQAALVTSVSSTTLATTSAATTAPQIIPGTF